MPSAPTLEALTIEVAGEFATGEISLLGPDHPNGRLQQLVHRPPDLVIGLRHALGGKILADLAEDVVIPGFLEVGDDQLIGVRLGLGARQPELLTAWTVTPSSSGSPATRWPLGGPRGGMARPNWARRKSRHLGRQSLCAPALPQGAEPIEGEEQRQERDHQRDQQGSD